MPRVRGRQDLQVLRLASLLRRALTAELVQVLFFSAAHLASFQQFLPDEAKFSFVERAEKEGGFARSSKTFHREIAREKEGSKGRELHANEHRNSTANSAIFFSPWTAWTQQTR